MKRQHAILALAFVVCAAVLAFTGKEPTDQVVEAAPRTATSTTTSTSTSAMTRVASHGTTPNIGIAELRARQDLFASVDGGHHDLFGSRFGAPPLPSAAPANADVPPLPPLPAAPSVPFTYLGKKWADGSWEVYLARGDETVIVKEQTVIDATYRVEEVKPPSMTLVYLPLKLIQTLDIGAAD